MKDMTNRPRISKWIGGGYLLLTVLVACIFAAVAVWSGVFSVLAAGIIFAIVIIFVLALLAVTAYGFYKTVYVIKDGILHSWSPFAVINLKITDIKSVEKTRIPFYFKGFGASLYSGIFYIPGLGWAKLIITNLTDGVLITDKNGKHYLITPLNPDHFLKL